MITSDPFVIHVGRGSIGGMTIKIARGSRSAPSVASHIHISDTAYSFVEPILRRLEPHYHPDTRFGIAEIEGSVWLEAVPELRSLAGRADAGDLLTPSDVAWLTTYDEDNNVEIDTNAFLQWLDTPGVRKDLSDFLAAYADWIESALEGETVLTIHGY